MRIFIVYEIRTLIILLFWNFVGGIFIYYCLPLFVARRLNFIFIEFLLWIKIVIIIIIVIVSIFLLIFTLITGSPSNIYFKFVTWIIILILFFSFFLFIIFFTKFSLKSSFIYLWSSLYSLIVAISIYIFFIRNLLLLNFIFINFFFF